MCGALSYTFTVIIQSVVAIQENAVTWLSFYRKHNQQFTRHFLRLILLFFTLVAAARVMVSFKPLLSI